MICNCDDNPPEGWGKHNHLKCGLCIPLLECDCGIALPFEKIYAHYLNTGHIGEYAANGELVKMGVDGRLQLCPECGKPMFVSLDTGTFDHAGCSRKILNTNGILSLLHLGRFKARSHLQP